MLAPTFSWERTFFDRQKPGHPFGCPGQGNLICQVRTMPDHTGFTRLSSSRMLDSLAVGPADLLEVTLQHALQSNAVASLVTGHLVDILLYSLLISILFFSIILRSLHQQNNTNNRRKEKT